MNYKNYQNARDAAWKILLDCGVERLPVDLKDICRQLGVRVRRYADVRGMSDAALQADGLTFFSWGKPVILYNQDKPPARIRFTIAHELGHLVLGHVAPRQRTTVNREPSPTDDPIETAANQFAARLLAPACVLWGMDIHTSEEISELCNISKQAAEFRAERMAVLYQRGKFLTSPLEQRVYERFLPFIKEYQDLRPQ
ncbi:MAG: ImmA/IrrE family metallo-endopeptidase [Oscillospiraceae bacterium]|nr:ImmA/IrrE family metallo-endopeptidase [Oscillospiraceae bacterium]